MIIDSILVKELEEARGQFRKLKAEYTELELKLAGGAPPSAASGRDAELEKKLTEQQAAIEQGRRQLEAVLKERDLLAEKVAGAESALQASRKECDTQKDDKESALGNANRELVEIRTQLGALGMERGQIAAELDQAKKAASAERDEFQKDRKKLETQAGQLQRDLAAAREKLGAAESERKQAASELADMRRALEASRDTLNSGQKTYAEALDKANKELVSIRARMGETEAAGNRAAAEAGELRKALGDGRREIETLRAENTKAATDFKTKIEAAEKKTAKLEADAKMLHANIERGSAELAAKREQLHKTRNEQQVTIDANERMTRELKEVRMQLSALQNERDNYAGEVLQLRAQIQEATVRSESGSVAQNRLREEMKSVQNELVSTRNRLKEVIEEHQKLAARSIEADKNLLESKKQIEFSLKECVALRQAAEQLAKDREHQARELGHVNAQFARVQGQMDALKLSNNELRQAHEQVKKELMQARQHLAAWQTENDTLEATLTSLESQLSSALKQITQQRGKSLAAA